MFIRKRLVLELQTALATVSARWEHTAHDVARLEAQVVALEKRVDSTASAVMRADLDDLRAAVDVDRAALRKQLGKLWGRIGREERADAPSAPEDPEFSGWLDLQQQHGARGD